MIVVDTSIVVAYMNRSDDDHLEVSSWLQEADDDLVTTPLALAEMDYLVTRHGGEPAARALHGDFESGAYLVDWWPGALHEMLGLAERQSSRGLGLVDASLIALAARVETLSVATLDERHFRAAPPAWGGAAFTLLPADAG